MSSALLEKICLQVLALSVLAQESPEQKLSACAVDDYIAVMKLFDAGAFSDDAFYAALGFPTGMQLSNISPSTLCQQQIKLGQWTSGTVISLGLYPCNSNGVAYPFINDSVIVPGQNIHLLAVNPLTHCTVNGEGLSALLPSPFWEEGLITVNYQTDPTHSGWADGESTKRFLAELLEKYHTIVRKLQDR